MNERSWLGAAWIRLCQSPRRTLSSLAVVWQTPRTDPCSSAVFFWPTNLPEWNKKKRGDVRELQKKKKKKALCCDVVKTKSSFLPTCLCSFTYFFNSSFMTFLVCLWMSSLFVLSSEKAWDMHSCNIHVSFTKETNTLTKSAEFVKRKNSLAFIFSFSSVMTFSVAFLLFSLSSDKRSSSFSWKKKKKKTPFLAKTQTKIIFWVCVLCKTSVKIAK